MYQALARNLEQLHKYLKVFNRLSKHYFLTSGFLDCSHHDTFSMVDNVMILYACSISFLHLISIFPAATKTFEKLQKL